MDFRFVIICEKLDGTRVQLLTYEPADIGSLKNGMRVVLCHNLKKNC